MRSALLLFIALLATAAQAQQMYRCGNTFSQSPCGPDATTVRGGGSQKTAASEPAADAASGAAAPRKNYWSAIARGAAEVGMTASELQSAMGTPNQRNAGQNGAGSDDQLVYYRADRTIYVYVRNGVVTAVQEQSGPPAATADATPKKSNCPSPASIRDLEFEASKIANRDNLMMRAQLANARACR